MSPKDDSRIRFITWFIGIGMPLIFVILVAYFPLINENSRSSERAVAKTDELTKIVNIKFENIEEKLGMHIQQSQNQVTNLKEDIRVNKQNFRNLADRLREDGFLKNLKIEERKYLSDTNLK